MNETAKISDRILSPNYIETFLLKINLKNKIDLEDFKMCFSSDFERYEEVTNKGFGITFSNNSQTLTPEQDIEKVFINERLNMKVYLSNKDTELTLRLNSYINNQSYLWIIEKLTSFFLEKDKEMRYMKISLRYINKYPCVEVKNIKKFFNNDISKHLLNAIEQGNRTRILLQEEFNFSPNRAKVVYGIPNKYYPNNLTEYDLLLDIDSSLITNDTINNLKRDIEVLNHSAFDVFNIFVSDTLFK